MKLTGRIWREGRFWLAEVPMLDALTQGRSEAEALRMLADLVETMVDRDGFRVTVSRRVGPSIEIGSTDPAVLAAVLLRRLREKHGLSLADVARRLGARSKTAYARYEQGDSVPTVAKFFQLLAAVVPGASFVLEERDGTDALANGAPVAAEDVAHYGPETPRTRERPGRRLTRAR